MKENVLNKTCYGKNRTAKLLIGFKLIFLTALLSACAEERPSHAYNTSAEDLENRFGKIIAVANIPTPDQHGTGDKMGLFRDKEGTVWGVPVSVGENQSLFGCAPTDLEKAQVSDTLPSDTVKIVGVTNEPTGWRGGTGELKLLLRTTQNKLRWYTVKAISLETDSPCWSKSKPFQKLKFYRLVTFDKEKEGFAN